MSATWSSMIRDHTPWRGGVVWSVHREQPGEHRSAEGSDTWQRQNSSPLVPCPPQLSLLFGVRTMHCAVISAACWGTQRAIRKLLLMQSKMRAMTHKQPCTLRSCCMKNNCFWRPLSLFWCSMRRPPSSGKIWCAWVRKSLFPLKNQTPVFKIATITVHCVRA